MSNITITLTGLLMIFENAKDCTVGFLYYAPHHHDFKISVSKKDAAGQPQPYKTLTEKEIAPDLSLQVKKNAPQISRCDKGINASIDRHNGPFGGNEESFLWVMNFEKDLYKKEVGSKKTAFRALFTVNDGELVTRQVSDNKLFTRVGMHGANETEFGFVAVKAGININLDQADNTAIFKNGSDVIFEADSKSDFLIQFDRGCPADQSGGNDGDFYYTAIGHLIPDEEKKFFTAKPPLIEIGPAPPGTPDAACFTGGGGSGPN